MLSRPRNPPAKRLLPSASWRLSHQVKLSRSFWKTRSRKSRSPGAVDQEDPDRGEGVYRWVDVVEVPFVSGQRPVGMLEPLPQQHEELVLGEGRIEVCPRDGVEGEVPRSEPGILPRVRHGQHVEGVQVAPARVTARAMPGRRRRLVWVAVQPPAHPVRVDLLAPDQTGAGLPEHAHPVGVELAAGQRCVELVGLTSRAAMTSSKEAPNGLSRSGSWRGSGRWSRRRSSALPWAGTDNRYHQDAFVPRRAGFTVPAPLMTWSLIPSLG